MTKKGSDGEANSDDAAVQYARTLIDADVVGSGGRPANQHRLESERIERPHRHCLLHRPNLSLPSWQVSGKPQSYSLRSPLLDGTELPCCRHRHRSTTSRPSKLTEP